jgi:hypothetical protein
MRRLLTATLSLLLLSSAVLAAAEFWETKPFLQWTDKEVNKLLTDSPWAVTIGVALPPALPRESEAPNAQGGGRGGGDGFGAAPRRIQMQLSWRSALPLRQAVVRGQVGLGGTPSAELQQFLEREADYVIAVAGLPLQYSRGEIEAFLRRKNKAPIPVGDAATQKTAAGPVLLMAFPRADPITAEDSDVELTFKADRFEFKRRFNLKNMVVAGRLEL